MTINNNVYQANGNGGVFGKSFFDITSLSAWQTALGQDANSFNEDPHFINPNGSVSTVDLHINPNSHQ
ncbi:MAG: hypothetical protein IPL53_24240 [Ignavibacteria bacterium]|nr:hypothetical protein [Ignavibacteria bacterium]